MFMIRWYAWALVVRQEIMVFSQVALFILEVFLQVSLSRLSNLNCRIFPLLVSSFIFVFLAVVFLLGQFLRLCLRNGH